MTAPYFSSTTNMKFLVAGTMELSSTAYTFGFRMFVSSTVAGNFQTIFKATSRDNESVHNRISFQHNPLAGVYRIMQTYSGGVNAQYRFSAGDNAWHSIFIVHDRNSPSPNNIPVVYVDRVTATITIISAAGNTNPIMPSSGAGFSIGAGPNVPGVPMRGFLQHVVWANGLWTKAQCDQFASAPGSFMQNVQFYYPFARADHNADYGGRSLTLSSADNTLGPTDHNATVSGGLRRVKLLRVGL